MVRSTWRPREGADNPRRCETTKRSGPKPIVVTDHTSPDELPPELRGTIFDSSHVERGAHLTEQQRKIDEVFDTEPRRTAKEDTDMATTATKTKPAAKAPAKTKAATKATAAPSQPFDRVAASAEWAAASPCQAATGPKRDPRPCKGVGVVERQTTEGKTIKVCAAHVLATEVQTVAERQAAVKAKEEAKAAKAAPKAAAKPAAKAKAGQPTKATPAPKPAAKAKAAAAK